MRTLFLAVLLSAAPGHTPEPVPAEAWRVSFASPVDEVAPALVCARSGEHALECVDLDVLLRTRDAERELERRKRVQAEQWRETGKIEL